MPRESINRVPNYNFRNTIKLADGYRLDVQGEQVVVLADEPAKIEIRPLPAETKFADTSDLLVEGGPFPSEEAAIEAGKNWRTYLLIAFAQQRLGIDLGPDDNPRAEPMAFLADKAAELGVQALRGRPGLLVFPSEPPATFGTFSAVAEVQRKPNDLIQSVDEVRSLRPSLTEAQELAFRLLHLAYFDTNPETRFILLVTAIEAVLEQGERSVEFIRWLEQLMSETKAADLDSRTRDAMLNYLGLGRRESIAASAKRLVEALGVDRSYDGKSPGAFFSACYTRRSDLVHGNLPRPTVAESKRLLPILERFVAEVLAANIGAQ
ncbi:hypothetical protein [Nocardia sp. NPDC047654]|uniref:hypothetical protein n=1 Tax=Nocardia sp. NPDC047654 TaxID=3364314 RepID=UPI003719667D